MKVKVYNQSGKETGTAELPDGIFGLKWNADLVHQVVTSQSSNLRRGTAHAKPRGEVRGGGRKPWRQKGTGRARHGSIRSPIWIGGGVTHGPLKDKNYKRKINKKMAKKALFTVLSAKARDGEVIVTDGFEIPEAKTKFVAGIFKNLSVHGGFENLCKGNGVLAVLPGKDAMAKRAMRNLPYAKPDEARNLNAHRVLQYKYILFPEDVIKNFK